MGIFQQLLSYWSFHCPAERQACLFVLNKIYFKKYKNRNSAFSKTKAYFHLAWYTICKESDFLIDSCRQRVVTLLGFFWITVLFSVRIAVLACNNEKIARAWKSMVITWPSHVGPKNMCMYVQLLQLPFSFQWGVLWFAHSYHMVPGKIWAWVYD